jgi:hypothetical protein
MDKTIKVVRYLFSIALVGCSVLSIVLFIHSNQVVAIAEGNYILYDNETYVETFEVFDYEKGSCLGRVDFTAYGSKYRMYSIREMPNYIFVDMGMTDYRIYKKISE